MSENHPFNDCWVQSRVEDLQSDLLSILDPLVDQEKLEPVGKPLLNSIERLLTSSFHFRARCVPPAGFCYELLHFKGEDSFDPNYMEAQELDGTALSASDESSHSYGVVMCTHGCLLAHPVEPGSRHDSLQVQKSSFVCLARRSLDRGQCATGILKSGKAAVIVHRK